MKLGIMQPYFLPYWGYWQLISAVDRYIIYDDVNYIKGGWINRNYILSNGSKNYLTLNLLGASSNKKIYETSIIDNKCKLLKTITQNYAKRPEWGKVKYLLEDIIMYKSQNLSEYLVYGINAIIKYMVIDVEVVVSSMNSVALEYRGQERVKKICQFYNAKKYINAIGGMALYSREEFEKEGILLSYLQPNIFSYEQGSDKFIPSLSIVDILCNVDIEIIKGNLRNFKLI